MLRSWTIIALLVGSGLALLPGSAAAAGRLTLSASPRVVEPGDAVTFVLKGGRGKCTVRGRAQLGGRIRGTLTKTVPATAKAGNYVARVTCGRRAATARFIVHGPSGPDFALSLTVAGKPDKRTKTQLYRVEARNLAPWTATTVRLCLRIAGRRMTAVKDAAALRSATVACSIQTQVPGGQARGFRLQVKGSSKLRVTAAVASTNSLRATRKFTVGARIRAGKAATATAVTRARAAQTPAPAVTGCTNAGRVGVAFVADDSGSMLDSDPADLRGRAIEVGLDQLPDGSLASATRFADDSAELFGPTELGPATRPALKTAAGGLDSAGGTDYEVAFRGALEQLSLMNTPRKAVIFLSDGVPSYNDYTADREIAAAGVPIFTIGFGSADEGVLAAIAARSGGQAFTAGSADDVQSIFARVVATLTCANATVRTTLALAPGETQVVPFGIGWEDGEFRALAAWSGGHLTVTAVRPDASVMAGGALRRGESLSDNPTYALLVGADPPVGTWQLRIASDIGNASNVNVSIDVFKKGLPPLPVHDPIVVKTQGRAADPCLEMYGGSRSTTKNIRLGTETNWDRASSLYQVCAGWGSEDPTIEWSLGMKCAFVSATAVLLGGQLADPAVRTFEKLCSATDTLNELQSGNFAGVAGQWGCNEFGSLFSTAAGIIVAGATVETGPGAVFFGTATYRAFAAGFKLACGGVFSVVSQWGYKHEAEHEAAIARDIASKGKCLRLTTRKALISVTSWSAADCPGSGGGGW